MTDEPICEVDSNGTKEWWLNSERHRTDGPAIEYATGETRWFLNGKLHRTDGPAIEWANGDNHWYLNNKLHRTDGPAIEYANGTKFWYLNGQKMTEEEHRSITALYNWITSARLVK